MEKKRVIRKSYVAFSEMNKQELFAFFHSTNQGMNEAKIEESREKYGENSISYGKKSPFFLEVLKAYVTPFTLVLIALGVISFITEYLLPVPKDKDLFGVIIIFSMVLVSGTMTLVQSVRSNQAAEKLKSLVKVTAAVKRNGSYIEIPMEEIVCGDLVRLSAGDMIPADMRLLSTKDLFISQAA